MKVDNSNSSTNNLKILEFQEQQSTENLGEIKSEQILCQHCLRTSSNGIKCQGICVADSGY
ncbi:MAG: hypothetical protein ACKPCM_02950 [Pseudanabaena sp.]